MQIKVVLISIIVSVTCLTTSASEAFLPKEYFVLPNGLKVYLCPDHSQPKVFGLVMCKAGSKDDPADATGVAHYMEHMLFKGTTELGTVNWENEKPHIDSIFKLYDLLSATKDDVKRKEIQQLINNESIVAGQYALPDEFSNLVKSIGGTDMNAATYPDITVFYNTFPPNQINKWIDLYAHRFTNPVFRSFQSELEVVYEEKNKRLDNSYSAFLELFLKNFFKVHPYGQRTSLGTIEDLKNPSLTRMFEFYQSYYYANNMVLVLSGDFDPDMVRGWISNKFGVWKTGKIPSKKIYEEKPFQGREFVEVSSTPIEMGLLGFRTVPKNHPDQIYLEIISNMLSNENKTGVLDKLVINNELLAAQIMPLNYNDQDGIVMAFAPRMETQKLSDAEALVLSEVEKIKKGEFSETLLESVKTERYKNFQLSLESIEQKAMAIAKAEGREQDFDEVFSYPTRVKNVKAADIIRVANQYFTSNYLSFYSHAGEVVKEKMQKPDFKPVVAHSGEHSVYANYFNTLPSLSYAPSPIDFSTSVKTIQITKDLNLKCTQNSYNDIFSLSLRFGVGTDKLPNLKYAIELVFFSGIDGMNLFQFKEKLSEMGCFYDLKVDRNFLNIEVEGPDKYLPKALELVGKLIKKPVPDKDKLVQIIDNITALRKIEQTNADAVSNALLEYVMYGKQSDYLNRPKLDELKKLDANKLVETFQQASKYSLDVYYTGQLDPNTVASELKKNVDINVTRQNISQLQSKPLKQYKKNTVYYVEKKGSLQSKVYFYSLGPKFRRSIEPYSEAFNLYFGGDFSGLVMQEIRQSRSLAYSTSAEIVLPITEKQPVYFKGYLGTQNDKLIQALEVFNSLVRDMPRKPEKLKMTQDYLILSAITSKPNMRQLAMTIDEWKNKGYTRDPLVEKYPVYGNLTFEDVYNFYEGYVKYRPLAILIVGDLNENDKKQLSRFGKFIEIKDKELFR